MGSTETHTQRDDGSFGQKGVEFQPVTIDKIWQNDVDIWRLVLIQGSKDYTTHSDGTLITLSISNPNLWLLIFDPDLHKSTGKPALLYSMGDLQDPKMEVC